MLIGLTMGAEGDLLAYLLSRYFGLRSFSAIYGMGLVVFGIGYGGAPFASGLLFDHLRNYDLGYAILAVLLVVCVGVALSFGRYPDFGAPAPDQGGEVPDGAAPAQRTA
jgi:MFS family permease